MILNQLQIPLGTIKELSVCPCKLEEGEFPLLVIDRDSYIIDAAIETGIDAHWEGYVHNLMIGRHSAISAGVSFVIDMNHDYLSVSQGYISSINDDDKERHKHKHKRKGQIIIENDCWVGRGATIMAGVTIHNGAVVGANAVVTKDVPPYAIVAGNPARIVKYRFPQETIDELLKIAWWDWDLKEISASKDLMRGDVDTFVKCFRRELPKPDESQAFFERMTNGKRYVYYLDLGVPHSHKICNNYPPHSSASHVE